jgi:hypothetical protein
MAYIIGGILLYLAFRFITSFLLPVYKAVSTVKKQFDTIKTQMDPQTTQNGWPEKNTELEEKPKYDLGGEYIPFEEIKGK